MDDYQLLIDLHRDAHRQGPGGDAETRIALDLSMLDQTAPLRVADIGCGTGAATIPLARGLNAQIIAVDLLPEFLEALQERARDAGVFEQISTLSCSMDNLPFQEEEFDVIWSEGAIYNIGFEHGIKAWRQYLKEAGVLVVSEISWITASRPAGLQQYWEAEYPEIDVASAKIALLEKNGYSPIGYFVLPEHCWLDNYYRPLQDRFEAFLRRNGDSQEARAIVAAENREIELYEKHRAYYSYGVYVARRQSF